MTNPPDFDDQDHNEPSDWLVIQLEDEGLPLILRIRSAFPEDFEAEGYPFMLAIQWEYESESNHGLPGEVARSAMDAFEDAIDEKLESSGEAFMTMVMTSKGVREWQFYTHDPEAAVKLVNEVLAGKPPLPIELTAAKDPEWEGYFRWVNILADLADDEE